MLFSERYGYKKVRDAIQIESMDTVLRNKLWDILSYRIWFHVKADAGGYYDLRYKNLEIFVLCEAIWTQYFNKPADQFSTSWKVVNAELRNYFFNCEWYEAYDFLEFVAQYFPFESNKDDFIKSCNEVLEKEMSGYRFVHNTISRVTEATEISTIADALESGNNGVRTHLNRALEMLSDRKSPDHRNSIKESISAVESLVQSVLGEKGTLGQLIKKISDHDIHPALKSAFSSLYGYTSDEEGIRHAILESSNIGLEEAMFFLVTCSAFVTFVEAKLAK